MLTAPVNNGDAARNVPPASPAEGGASRNRRSNLPKETTDFLKAWLYKHANNPYPSEEEKKRICHVTGLSITQVSNWMINVRRWIFRSHFWVLTNFIRPEDDIYPRVFERVLTSWHNPAPLIIPLNCSLTLCRALLFRYTSTMTFLIE
jgi:hypothetical protein